MYFLKCTYPFTNKNNFFFLLSHFTFSSEFFNLLQHNFSLLIKNKLKKDSMYLYTYLLYKSSFLEILRKQWFFSTINAVEVSFKFFHIYHIIYVSFKFSTSSLVCLLSLSIRLQPLNKFGWHSCSLSTLCLIFCIILCFTSM